MGKRLGITGAHAAHDWLMAYRDSQYGSSFQGLNSRGGCFQAPSASPPQASAPAPATNVRIVPEPVAGDHAKPQFSGS